MPPEVSSRELWSPPVLVPPPCVWSVLRRAVGLATGVRRSGSIIFFANDKMSFRVAGRAWQLLQIKQFPVHTTWIWLECLEQKLHWGSWPEADFWDDSEDGSEDDRCSPPTAFEWGRDDLAPPLVDVGRDIYPSGRALFIYITYLVYYIIEWSWRSALGLLLTEPFFSLDSS